MFRKILSVGLSLLLLFALTSAPNIFAGGQGQAVMQIADGGNDSPGGG